MDFKEKKNQFIQTWGALGGQWGVNKTMAQIHAILLINPNSMSTEEIMEELKISRGNANMNLRSLIEWGLVFKDLKAGERKEYFKAEKDIWKVSSRIIKERKKRELEPLNQVLGILNSNQELKNEEERHFNQIVNDIKKVANQADKALDFFSKAEENKLQNLLIKMIL